MNVTVTGRRLVCLGKSALLAVALMSIGQSANISVRELPPEPIPHGTCTKGHSGYLGIESSSRFKLTEEEIGAYVVQQLKEGYSLKLYPQASGRIFAIATCEATVSAQ
jgi:hypothetical protein